MDRNTRFQIPNTTNSLIVWHRDGKLHEVSVRTPKNGRDLQNLLLPHRVGIGEVRAVKADPDSRVTNTATVNLGALVSAMTGNFRR